MYSLNETDDENRPQCSQNSTVLDFSFFFKSYRSYASF